MHVDGYFPAVLALVAVVEQDGRVLSDEGVSAFRNPEYCAVIVGGVPPWVKEPLEAVTVSGAPSTTATPGAYVMTYAGSEAPEHVLAPVYVPTTVVGPTVEVHVGGVTRDPPMGGVYSGVTVGVLP